MSATGLQSADPMQNGGGGMDGGPHDRPGAGLHVHLDAAGGVAGDMFVAAMLSARPDLAERVLADAAAVLPAGLSPRLEPGTSGGIAVLRLALAGAPADGHHHADYPSLAARIDAAPLAEGTAEAACAILARLAEAEAEVHGIPVARVHFHELADWDSLMDVVAAGSIAAALAGASWSVSDLPLGGGMVRTAHGLLPVPAPATARLLRGFRFRDDGIPGERVTPTGAAIIAHLAGSARPGGTLRAAGEGAGTRELPGMPNILRALVFERAEALTGDEVAVLTFDVDDMTGEEIAVAVDRLRAAPGVLDVTLAARSGKKGRPVTEFRLLARPGEEHAVGRLCLLETSTLGLRLGRERRVVLPRTEADAGGVSSKRAVRPDGTVTAKAASDDLSGTATLAARRALARAAEEAE